MHIYAAPDYHKKRRPEMAFFLPQEYQRVLEVGCAEGNFTEHLKPHCEIWGVEPNSLAAKAASQKMKYVLCAEYDQVSDQLPDDYFELVVCNDVIEHMRDHDFFLDSIRTKMKSKACLVGSVPNVRYYFTLYNLLLKKDWKYTAEGTLDRTHLRYFTEKSLKKSLHDHGFTIEIFKGINSARMLSQHFRDFIRTFLLDFITVVTLTAYRDIQFLEFGFRVRKVV